MTKMLIQENVFLGKIMNTVRIMQTCRCDKETLKHFSFCFLEKPHLKAKFCPFSTNFCSICKLTMYTFFPCTHISQFIYRFITIQNPIKLPYFCIPTHGQLAQKMDGTRIKSALWMLKFFGKREKRQLKILRAVQRFWKIILPSQNSDC